MFVGVVVRVEPDIGTIEHFESGQGPWVSKWVRSGLVSLGFRPAVLSYHPHLLVCALAAVFLST